MYGNLERNNGFPRGALLSPAFQEIRVLKAWTINLVMHKLSCESERCVGLSMIKGSVDT